MCKGFTKNTSRSPPRNKNYLANIIARSWGTNVKTTTNILNGEVDLLCITNFRLQLIHRSER